MLVFSVGAVVAACTLTSSLDGLTGGVSASLPDGPDTSSTPGAPDAADAGAPDAEVPDGPFCTRSSAAFCDAFDREPVSGAWSKVAISEGASATTAASTRAGSGREAVFSLPQAEGGGAAQAEVVRRFDGVKRWLRTSFAFIIESTTTQSAAQFMDLVFRDPQTRDLSLAGLFVGRSAINVFYQTLPGGSAPSGMFVFGPPAQPIAFDRWHRAAFEIQLVAPKRMDLAVDGVNVYSVALPDFFRPSEETVVTAGVHYVDPPYGPLTVRIDDLEVFFE